MVNDFGKMLIEGAPIRVRMEHITKRFGSVLSLDDVSLELRAGEVLGLVGDNGAGKSTLMKVLSGAVIPDRGRILIDGREIRMASPADARRERIEMVYQDLSLCDTIDVSGNVMLGREPKRRIVGVPFLDKKAMHARSAEMLGQLGIRIPDPRTKVAISLGRPAPEYRHRSRSLIRPPRPHHGRADGGARGGRSRRRPGPHPDRKRQGRRASS